MTRPHPGAGAVLLAALALLPAAAATAHRRPRVERCATGRFVVQAQPLIAGDQSGPAPDLIVLGMRELAIGSGCPATPRRLVETRKRSTLRATWASCPGLKGKVRLTARIDASCATMTGTLRARRFKRTFMAKAARCGDGVIEAGEQCEPPGSEGCDASCHLADAPIVPLTGTIQLPPGLAVDPTTLSVHDLLGSAIPTAAGQFSLPAAGAGGTLAVVAGPTGAPLLVGWLDAEHSVLSARTTAETIAFAAVGATTVSADAQAKVRLLLEALPEVQPLADAIAKAVAANPDLSAAATPDVLAALRALSAAVVPQQTAASRSGLWSRVASWFVSPAVAMLLVNPSSAQTGLTLFDTPDGMITTVPLDAFYLQNAYWRPAYAYVELVSIGIIPDAKSTVTRSRDFIYHAYREFPVAAVNPVQDTTGTIGQVVFGAVAGQPTAYVPVDSPMPPLPLPIYVPGITPTNTVEATYAVVVVGPGFVNTNGSLALDINGAAKPLVVNADQSAKQFELDTRYFVFDLMVPLALFTLDSRLPDILVQAPAGSGLGGAVSQFIKQFMMDAREVFMLLQQGQPGQALLKGVETLASNTALQTKLANLLVAAYLDAATLKTGFGAIQKLNAEEFLAQVKGALAVVHVFDQALNAVNMSAAWVNYVTGHSADAWAVTVRPAIVRLLPPSATLQNGQTATFTVTIPELSGSGEFVGYKWANTATVGHTTDGLPGHMDTFTSTQTAVTYAANSTGMGTDTITVQAFEGDPNHGAPLIGTASATVNVGMTTTTTMTTFVTTTTGPTTTTTLPPGGAQFFLGFPSACCASSGDNCANDVSLGGQTCFAQGAVICICSLGGKVIPNNSVYAYPGDSITMQCFACGVTCFNPELVLSNSVEIFPYDQVCTPPGNTWTDVFHMSVPIPFPETFAAQYCCEPPSSWCVGGPDYLAACNDPSDCDGFPCISGCFEYRVGRPEQQSCIQLGGGSVANYCGGMRTCGED